MQEGVEGGVLSEGTAIQLQFPHRGHVSMSYQDYYQRNVLEHFIKKDACGLLVQYLRNQGKYIIILVERIKHVEDLSERLADIPHRVVFGEVGKVKRREFRSKFENGKIRVLIANKVFKKGINIKRVDVIIDMAEMKSKNDTQQKYGRGVRLHPAKASLLYVDMGTQGNGVFGKAAGSRARALRQLGVKVKRVKVGSPQLALKALKQFLEPASQLKLDLQEPAK